MRRQLTELGWLCAALMVWLDAADVSADEPQKPPASVEEFAIDDDDRAHWSFRRIRPVSLPSVAGIQWCRQPIDRFILSRLEEEKLRPQSTVDRVTLIRRLKFDLLGLPPTVDEVNAFLADKQPLAYERLVERYLASPAFGERWGQYWLDLARFAETDGFEFDAIRPQAWRYRDWVIQALNKDMPYDQFVRMQIAGDEWKPQDAAAGIATSFCLSGPDMPDINSQDERRHNLLNELTATVSEAFMALQMGCSQCHDHKFDPISQGDFYRLRAIFSPAVKVQKRKSVSVLSESKAAAEADHLMIRGDWRRRGPAVTPDFPRIANPAQMKFARHRLETSTGRRSALADWLTSPAHPLTARVIVNRVWQHHFGRGLSSTPNDFGLVGAEPTHPDLLDWLAGELIESGWSLKRIHRQIVLSATYRQRSRQLSPETATAWSALTTADPENELWGRYPRRRLEGEVLRDAMLSAAGILNRRQGGPGVRPPLSRELVATLLKKQWVVTADAAEHDRRSIYIFARRNLRFPIFDVFDRPSGNCSCGERSRSTTASQSLLLINSEFSLQMARRLAGRVLQEKSKAPLVEQIAFAVQLCLSRAPTAAETKMFERFVLQQERLLRSENRSAKKLAAPLPATNVSAERGAALCDLCLALFNINEFIYID